MLSQKLRNQILTRDNHECQICYRKNKLHIHHVIPVRLMGRDIPSNLTAVCCVCHGMIELQGKITKYIKSTKPPKRLINCIKCNKQITTRHPKGKTIYCNGCQYRFVET